MKFILVGDIHGNFNTMRYTIEKRNIRDCTIIQVGDFGIGFLDQYNDRANVGQLSRYLESRNIKFYAIRGNHDNPAYFDGTWKFSNVELLPDYSVIEVDGDKICLVGGAISIDRKPRLAEMQEYAKYNKTKELYWFDENFVFDAEKASKIKDCKYVVTHTAPDFCWPNNKFGFGPLVEHFITMGDKKLKGELIHERAELTKLYNALIENNPIEKWFYGHFHKSERTEYNGIDFHLLDINEFYEVR